MENIHIVLFNRGLNSKFSIKGKFSVDKTAFDQHPQRVITQSVTESLAGNASGETSVQTYLRFLHFTIYNNKAVIKQSLENEEIYFDFIFYHISKYTET